MDKPTSTIAPRRSSAMRWLFRGVIAAAVLLAGVVLIAYRATQATPEFYTRALEHKLDPVRAKAAADTAEREVLAMQNELQRGEPTWQLDLGEEEVNSWLAMQLSRKMPKLLPPEIKDPRVVIDEHLLRVACQYDGAISGVLSLELEPTLTTQENTIAVRVRRLQLGSLPLPKKQYLDEVTKAMQSAGLNLRWEEEEGDPLGIVQIPTRFEKRPNRELRIEGLRLEPSRIKVHGSSRKAP